MALALTEDFRTFERCGARHAARRQGRRAAAPAHRRQLRAHPPPDDATRARTSGSRSRPISRNWGTHRPLLLARKGSWWDANKVGLSPPLIETPEGWLMLYHGVRQTASGALYRLGVALFDLELRAAASRAATRGSSDPRAATSAQGDVGNVVFPCGLTIGADGDTINSTTAPPTRASRWRRGASRSSSRG